MARMGSGRLADRADVGQNTITVRVPEYMSPGNASSGNYMTDGVQVGSPSMTHTGQHGFTYQSGASAETVGAKHICMAVLPMPPMRVRKPIITKELKQLAICS